MRRRNFIKCCAAAMAASSTAVLAEKPKPPNVVLIYGDDIGYGDVGVYGSKMIPTPNIDAFARQSLIFTDGHCTAATCSPSRFALLTGVYGFRHDVNIVPPDGRMEIPERKLTLPGMFKQAGYTTGIVGKWHLGLGSPGQPLDWNGAIKPGPLERGFDYSFLMPSTNDRVPCVYIKGHHVYNHDPDDPISVGARQVYPNSTVYPDGRRNPEAMTYYMNTHGHNHSVINGIGRIGTMYGGKAALWDDELMADEYVKRSKQFIEANKDEPFFLFYSSQDTHVPRTPHPRFHGKSELTYRGDAMVQFDWACGELIKTLEEHGLRENTIVIITSDNGPVYDDGYDDGTTVLTSTQPSDRGHYGAGPFRGGKYQIYEGGTRVPFIVGWPKKIKPGTSRALVSQIDFLASFAALLGVEVPDDQARDSMNTLDAFLGRDPIGAPYHIVEARRARGLRRGKWKFVLTRGMERFGGSGGPELYNLDLDIGETNNLIEEYPEIAQEMRSMLTRLIEQGRARA